MTFFWGQWIITLRSSHFKILTQTAVRKVWEITEQFGFLSKRHRGLPPGFVIFNGGMIGEHLEENWQEIVDFVQTGEEELE